MTTRDPTVLHQRVLGVLRLLGPHHWASWRLLLLGVELHCGAMEEAMIKAQVRQPCSGCRSLKRMQSRQWPYSTAATLAVALYHLLAVTTV